MQPWRREVRAQFRLAVPVVTIQVGLMMMGLVDAAFMGRVSATDLAGVFLGDTWTFVFLCFGMGTLTTLDPIISQAFGARDTTSIRRGMQRGIVLALLLSIPIVLVLPWAKPVLLLLNQPPAVVEIAATYSVILVGSVPAFLLFVAVRQGLQAMHILRPLVLVILLSNLANVFLDWTLIMGHLGCPALGATGSAIATVISRWIMVVLLLVISWPALRPYFSKLDPRALTLAPLWRMIRIGAPVGGQFTIEIGAFATVALMMGTLGEVELSGHNVALKLASFSFMVPLGISMAGSIRVGNAIGAGDPDSMRLAAKVAIAAGAGVMLLFAVAFISVPYPLARIFTDLDGVLEVAVLLLPIAGCFQVFDGTQVVAMGILRGSADTRTPMLIHLAGFWLVGVPIAYLLAFGLDLGPAGLWWGLVVALAAVAVTQVLRVRVRFARVIERVRVEDEEGE
jgi:multidrug resistance protein, MATE family